MDVVHDRRGERQQLARQPLHLLGHLEVRHPVLDQRLVDVEVEEADLGVGDPRQRLAVDAHELEEGDEREARPQRRGDVAQELEVVVADLVARRRREADRRPDPLDQRRLEPAQLGGLLQRARLAAGREEVLHEAVGEPAGLRRGPDLVQRVPALAQARDDARVGERRGRPAVVRQRHEALSGPAAERVRGDVELASDLGESHLEKDKAAGPRSWSRRLRAMRPAASAGGVRQRRRLARGFPLTSRPIALVGR